MPLRAVLRLLFVEPLRSLRRNTVRSALAMLGIAVAVAIVITVLALGRASVEASERELDKLGDNLVWVEAGSRNVAGARTGTHGMTTLVPRDAEAIRREVPQIKYVSENVDGDFLVIYQDRNWRARWRGVAPAYRTIKRWELARGMFFDEEQTEHAALVVVIGETVRRELFAGVDPIGELVRIQGLNFEVVGVLAAKGQAATGQDQDDTVMMPWTTAMKRIVGKDQTWLDDILCSARSSAELTTSSAQIADLLRERHHLEPGAPDDFNLRHPEELLQARIKTSRTLRLLLLLLASTSLAVGGIGVMNVMLASVSQRITEIGLRCAVGARPSAIVLQFLGEAVALSVIGGGAGVAIGQLSAYVFEHRLGWTLAMSPEIDVIAVLASAVAGVVFGAYPAARAARLDPIVALRAE
jgi:ABC-type antimicrobial peptide transport system permease subunit